MGDTKDPDLPPDRLPSVNNDTTFNAEKIREAANKHLRPDHDLLAGKGIGTLQDFHTESGSQPRGRVTSDQLGNYPAVVNGLQITIKNAYDRVGSVYESFLKSYEDHGNSLAKVGLNYGGTEDTNRDNAKGANPRAV